MYALHKQFINFWTCYDSIKNTQYNPLTDIYFVFRLIITITKKVRYPSSH